MAKSLLRRNFLQQALGLALSNVLADNKGARTTFAAALYLTGDTLKNGASLYHISKQTMAMLENRKLMSNLFHVIGVIDDIVDGMTPQERLAAGAAIEGNTPCEFLNNQDVCVPAYHRLIQKIADIGLLSYEEEVAFSNLYAVLIHEGAKAELDFLESPSPQNRQKINDANLKLAEIIGIHVMQHCVRDKEITSRARASGLSYDDAMQLFPRAGQLSRLAEVIDDLRDVFIDLLREKQTGIISPNTILTKLYEKGSGYAPNGKLQREMHDFLMRHMNDPHSIPYEIYPEPLKRAINAVQDEFFTEAYTLNPIHRDVMITWWRVAQDQGLFSPAHPDVMEAQAEDCIRLEAASQILEMGRG